MSSVIPSANRSHLASPERLSNGSTATDGLAGGGSPGQQPPARRPRPETSSRTARPPPAAAQAPAAPRGGTPVRPRRRPVQPHPIRPHRPGDVLDLLLAGELQRQPEPALQVVEGRAGDQHAAGLAQLLQAGGDVDAVAQEVVALDHHVAEVDADAEHDPPVGRRLGLAVGHRLLHRHRAGDRVDHRGELDDRPVAHQLDDAALVLGQQRVDRAARASSLIAASVPASSCSISRE